MLYKLSNEKHNNDDDVTTVRKTCLRTMRSLDGWGS